MITSRVISVLQLLIVMVPVCAYSDLGSYGVGSIELLSYNSKSKEMVLLSRFVPNVTIGQGRLYLYKCGPEGPPQDSILLWEGAVDKDDTLSVTRKISDLPIGLSRLATEMYTPVPVDQGVHHFGLSVLYIEVSDTEVLVSNSGFSGIDAQKISRAMAGYESELRRRGVYSVRLDSVQLLAPDILSRIEDSLGISHVSDDTKEASRRRHNAEYLPRQSQGDASSKKATTPDGSGGADPDPGLPESRPAHGTSQGIETVDLKPVPEIGIGSIKGEQSDRRLPDSAGARGISASDTVRMLSEDTSSSDYSTSKESQEKRDAVRDNEGPP